jgi:hypothetical protein
MKAVLSRPVRPSPCKAARISILSAKAHHLRDFYELATPVALLHLTVDQLRCYLPTFARCALGKPPGPTDQSGP